MQQYSSLSDQNAKINATPTLLATIQQLQAELWLERRLNQLQNRLNNCLASVFTTEQQQVPPEAEIFQTLVNELHSTLNTTRVVIALVQPQENVAKVCYVSRSSSQRLEPQQPGIKQNEEKKLALKLNQVISIEDLKSLENQQPPNAWQLSDHLGVVIGWLIVATKPLPSGYESLEDICATLTSQFMAIAASQCSTAIAQLTKVQSLQQQCQALANHNQDLLRTNQLKNQFLANTSHEIRTPLSSIIGFTHLLLAKGYDPTQERHQEYLHIIQSSGKHLLALINDILDLSKIEANQLDLQYETVEVQPLCDTLIALVKEKAANKGLKLKVDIDPGVTSFVADPLRIKQMLLNLLFNALKFTNKGTVGLQVKLNGSFIHFRVWDTGTGISPEDQAELFQPYFQIANPAASREEGTGLGLAVTKKLAELHGGYVELTSEVDLGSSFTIVLPLRQGGAEQETDIEAELGSEEMNNSSVSPSPNWDVLLVEDDLPNGQMIQTYLERLHYQVTWVKSAAEMWEALHNIYPAAILMDIKLPDSNGLDLVQQLRDHDQYKMIPIIAQTAMAMKGDRDICLAAGINDYISKPIDLELLGTIVSKYCKSPEK
ncbi:hybrid histidine kinase/response regulator HrmK [Aetokthonos hydrillicola Thurmond2011]|jgi:hypothetical protein|uniref:Circadian input-output histidine kinase CikA n=1 Tax=Aetokthonos hydrillicola Thurmond2011 TaxID=2712845 RepID=A0AAP5I4U9_9CYAN|nr:hybrid histidine kinase/response regulator HrmK [Aetokthonos hydrillicola]MBO3457538.1 response regulator [Aetokthonos hydrillicola CCALA 1050]MBW4590748.1 hybrid histidine kinase/response regulator HrmK [Aetokthonos hydrillicola CCALA 1050]MDR9894781.1 hybrid histidine kinase/response regulator HrmK [Aetokthonos hydrillicola Thurmond2011]